jgi:RNA 2',3'-cyclic 3'-phosphodiesterase
MMAELASPIERVFIALPLPDHVRLLGVAARSPAQAAAPGLTWTRPEGWHVTLAFLGAVPAAETARVAELLRSTVAALPVGPLQLRLDGAGRFARSVLWLGLRDEPTGAVAQLAVGIQDAVEAAGFPVERRRSVRPHITLARGSRRAGDIDDALVATVAPVEVTWEADEVQLLRSVTGQGPARYEPLASIPLTG